MDAQLNNVVALSKSFAHKRKLSDSTGDEKNSTDDTTSTSNHGTGNRNPVDYMQVVLEGRGYDLANSPFHVGMPFIKPTQEMIDAYTLDAVAAARAGNIPELRRLHSRGVSLQCCNRFGESLIHHVCRRGDLETVRFLVEEAGVSLLIRDDYGRTPLHDACWTSKPRVDLVQYIAEKEPALLCVKDVRGHLPFSYARQEHWGIWHKFLKENTALLHAGHVLYQKMFLPPFPPPPPPKENES